MNHDVEEELRFLYTEEALENYQVPRTAHGQEFRNSLDYSQNDGLEDGNQLLLISTDTCGPVSPTCLSHLNDLNQDVKRLQAAQHHRGYNSPGHQDPYNIGNNEFPVAKPQEIGTQCSGVGSRSRKRNPYEQGHPHLPVSINGPLNSPLSPRNGPPVEAMNPLEPQQQTDGLIQEEVYQGTEHDIGHGTNDENS